ncbi:hypothetical protein DFQ14_10333 [Halopolyspora algeriensis]|uniref:Uncharacterized protein n=1 Tax=Halopolyspora algeriensis TaxID=1500506 RepID=A0A368VSU0_9ACTN|nr:hypothetical protein [Halopolyspora algeriensis]RCW45072.1 hypothetical protein DFQ14_10333 [Halopolyspora algeriensis]TQM53203.1 hypothetical protein FHU43_2589 [Halopolyspora algeriensis]
MTSSTEAEDAVPRGIRRCLRNGGICLLLALIDGYAAQLMAGENGLHSAAFRYAGVALVFLTMGLAIAGLWQLARGVHLWWKSRVPESSTRRGFSRFMLALRRDPGKPAHKLPLWQPFTLAVVLTYAAYFDYGAFLANNHSDTSPAEGRLVVESCEPNWTVLGLRSRCTGTITPLEGHFQHGEKVHYDAWFSRFDRTDVGRTVDVFDSFEGIRGRTWKGVTANEPPMLAELLIGVLALFAFLFWYLFLARAVVRGVAIAGNKVRGRSNAEEQPESTAPGPEATARTTGERVAARPHISGKSLWRSWGAAAVLAYATYFGYGMVIAGEHGGSDIRSVSGHLVLESCEPNWTVLGLRSSCKGMVTPKEGFEDRPNRYGREFSQFGASDVGKRIPVYMGSGSEWQPKYRQSTPRWLGILVLPLVIGALITTFRSIVLTILAIGAARSRSQRSPYSSPDSTTGQ